MRGLKTLVGGLAAASILGLAGNAGAVVYTATWVGTVSTMQDDGTFGTFDGSLAGAAYTAIFHVDTSLGVIEGGPNGKNYDHGGPFQSVSLTINGITRDLGVITGGEIQEVFNDPYLDQYQLDSASNNDYLSNAIYCHPFCPAGHDIGVDGDAGTPPTSYAVQDGDLADGIFKFGGASGALAPTSFSIAVDSVAEPETWALLIAGFAVCGGALRRRRTELPAA